MEIDVIDVLIDQTQNGNMENVDVNQDTHSTDHNVWEIKSELILLILAMLLLSTTINKKDVCHAQKDA